jgi:hypothetical protein
LAQLTRWGPLLNWYNDSRANTPKEATTAASSINAILSIRTTREPRLSFRWRGDRRRTTDAKSGKGSRRTGSDHPGECGPDGRNGAEQEFGAACHGTFTGFGAHILAHIHA